jgi:hypothetical protein
MVTLTAAMETMDAVVRRPLPPVPRSGDAQEIGQAAATSRRPVSHCRP